MWLVEWRTSTSHTLTSRSLSFDDAERTKLALRAILKHARWFHWGCELSVMLRLGEFCPAGFAPKRDGGGSTWCSSWKQTHLAGLNLPLCVKYSRTPWAVFAALLGDGSDMVLFCFWWWFLAVILHATLPRSLQTLNGPQTLPCGYGIGESAQCHAFGQFAVIDCASVSSIAGRCHATGQPADLTFGYRCRAASRLSCCWRYSHWTWSQW